MGCCWLLDPNDQCEGRVGVQTLFARATGSGSVDYYHVYGKLEREWFAPEDAAPAAGDDAATAEAKAT